eukprot:768441-Hanusia_phi.AAC.23
MAILTSMLPSNGQNFQSELLLGSNFGLEDNSLQLSLGGTASMVTAWKSDSSIRTKVAHGYSGGLSISLTLAALVGTLSTSFTYNSPSLVPLLHQNPVEIRKNGPMTGMISLTYVGYFLGRDDSTLRVSQGFTACEATSWKSESTVACKSSSGIGRQVSIIISENSNLAQAKAGQTTFEMFSFDCPSMSSVKVTNGPGASLPNSTYCFGQLTSRWDVSANLGFSGTSSSSTSWLSTTSIAAMFPEGSWTTRSKGAIVVTASLCSGTLTNAVSIDYPSISGIFQSNSPGVGGQIITVYGINFGSWDLSLVIGIGDVMCTSTTWLSDSSLAIKPSGYYGKNLNIQFASWQADSKPFISDQESHAVAMSNAISYDYPVIIALDPTSVTPRNSKDESLRLEGVNFGGLDSSPVVWIGKTMCAHSQWISDDVVWCNQIPTGIGFELDVMVEVSKQRSTLYFSFSYRSPGIFHYSGNDTTAFVGGENFGINDESASARFGFSAAESTRFISDSSLVCRAADGAGNGLDLSITVARQSGTKFSVFSYQSPSILGVSEWNQTKVSSNFAISGSVIWVNGGSFSPYDYSPQARLNFASGLRQYDATSSETTIWVSSSTIKTQIASGVNDVGPNLGLDLTVSGQSPSPSCNRIILSYDEVSVSHAHQMNHFAPLSAKIQIYSKNVGRSDYSGRIRLGGTECEASFWTSESTLTCYPAPDSYFNNADLVISIFSFSSKGTSTLTHSHSYDVPTLKLAVSQSYLERERSAENSSDTDISQAVRNAVLLPNVYLGNTAAMSNFKGPLYLLGNHFGKFDTSLALRAGFTSCESTVWLLDTVIVCNTPLECCQSSKSVALTSGVTRPSTLSTVLSFDSLSLIGISKFNLPLYALTGLLIYSKGSLQSQNTVTSRFGQTVCKGTTWISATSLSANFANGQRSSHSVVTTISMKTSSITNILSFDAPLFWFVSSNSSMRTNGPVTSATSIYLNSHQAGEFVTARIRIAKSACEASQWICYTQIKCLMYSGHVSGYIPTQIGDMPINVMRASDEFIRYRGVEHNGQIVVTVGNVISSISQAFSFDLPSIREFNITLSPIFPSHASVIAGKIHEIAGIGFSMYDTSPRIRLGDTSSERTRWDSESRLSIRAGHGTGHEIPITLTISLAKVSFTRAFTYDAPDMIWIRPTYSSTIAQDPVEIFGRDFGPFDLTGRGRIGGTAMEVTKWLSTTSLTSYISSGLSFNLEVVLSAALWSVATITVQNMNEFNFLPPSSTALSPPNGPINGGFSLTVFGFNYGLYDSTLGGHLGDQSCQATVWVSDSSALCQGM